MTKILLLIFIEVFYKMYKFSTFKQNLDTVIERTRKRKNRLVGIKPKKTLVVN